MTKPPVIWFDKEEEYLKYLQQLSQHLSERYMELYKRTHAKQTNLRLPAIILSSFSGVASFGNTSFPQQYQRYVSISVGLINITIAMIQTYESYLKIADTVSKALTVSISLKKLADDIYCEMYIPIEDRETNGITFLRDAFSRYGAIIYQAPPLEDESIDKDKNADIINKIGSEIKKYNKAVRVEHGNTLIEPMTPSPLRNNGNMTSSDNRKLFEELNKTMKEGGLPSGSFGSTASFVKGLERSMTGAAGGAAGAAAGGVAGAAAAAATGAAALPRSKSIFKGIKEETGIELSNVKVEKL